MTDEPRRYGLSVAFGTIWWPLGFLDDHMVFVPIGNEYMTVTRRGVLHAAEVKAKATRRKTIDTVCSKRGYPLVAHLGIDALIPAWPAPARFLGYTRCAECWQETGKRRPDRMFRDMTFEQRAVA